MLDRFRILGHGNTPCMQRASLYGSVSGDFQVADAPPRKNTELIQVPGVGIHECLTEREADDLAAGLKKMEDAYLVS